MFQPRTLPKTPTLAWLVVAALQPIAAGAQDLAAEPSLGEPPSPFDFVIQLDLECRTVEGPAPVDELGIRQLNPVLKDKLPNQRVELGPLKRVCVPVLKDHEVHAPAALQWTRWVDLACYQAKAEP